MSLTINDHAQLRVLKFFEVCVLLIPEFADEYVYIHIAEI